MADTDLLLICPKCGARNYADDPFCDQCHAPLSKGDTPSSPPSKSPLEYDAVAGSDMRCKSCGAPLPPTKVGDVAICAYCHTSMVVEFEPDRPKGPPGPISWDDDIYANRDLGSFQPHKRRKRLGGF